MMTNEELKMILEAFDLPRFLTLSGCGKLGSLSCYACDPNLRSAVGHINRVLNPAERDAIFSSICGCNIAPTPNTPSTPTVNVPTSPTPVPTVPVVSEEPCPDKLPAAGTFTGSASA